MATEAPKNADERREYSVFKPPAMPAFKIQTVPFERRTRISNPVRETIRAIKAGSSLIWLFIQKTSLVLDFSGIKSLYFAPFVLYFCTLIRRKRKRLSILFFRNFLLIHG